MKFSIIVPVYNVEKYVEECIQSVLSQTFTDYELILVDDGSTDCSGKLCDDYAEKYPQIKAYHKPNSGQLHTREYAISKACGEWYVFLDSDDSLKSHALETINQYTYEADCIIYGFERVLNGNVIFREHDSQLIRTDDKLQIYRKVFINGGYNALWRKAVKANLVGKIDYSEYYHISLGEDLLQSLEVLGNSTTVVFMPEVLYRYRVNPNSMTQSVKEKSFSIDFTVREKTLEFLQNQNIFLEEDYNAYRNYCIDIGIFENVSILAKIDMVQEQKRILLNQLKKEKYYTGFLSKGYSKEYKNWKRRLVFRLYKMNLFHVLLIILKR